MYGFEIIYIELYIQVIIIIIYNINNNNVTN